MFSFGRCLYENEVLRGSRGDFWIQRSEIYLLRSRITSLELISGRTPLFHRSKPVKRRLPGVHLRSTSFGGPGLGPRRAPGLLWVHRAPLKGPSFWCLGPFNRTPLGGLIMPPPGPLIERPLLARSVLWWRPHILNW